ncbi:glycosyltransferase family 15 protein [Collybiopsis luxurians FD-317 M1]|uniref:Glycosyltransferase family 15 protein n=1 Tax=Collybiopsis luxurians FD-317 M1 TaxID=944289 RepID=A0A0D0CFV7_9AGAR|nr:glycosyltransferase family 15 protein [Collybiopsis luxurians FD-317 M1]
MCRFYSGFFYKRPLLQNFKYYWTTNLMDGLHLPSTTTVTNAPLDKLRLRNVGSITVRDEPTLWDTDWTNFEIGDLDFFRESEGYNKYFEHLDATGGFITSAGETHRGTGLPYPFSSTAIGFAYEHTARKQCPDPSTPAYERGRCTCDYKNSIAVKWKRYSCQADFDAALAVPRAAGAG